MAGLRRWQFDRVAGAVLATLLVTGAGSFLIRDLRFTDVTRAAEAVQEGIAFDPPAFRHLSDHAGFRRAAADCRGVGASATLQLAALDHMPAAADQALQMERFERARNIIAFELSCSPLDGAAWLAYGRILIELEGGEGQGISALALSMQTAPAEPKILFARLWYLQWLSAVSDVETWNLLATDLGIAVRHLDPRDLAWLYAHAPAAAHLHYRALLSAVPEPRRQAFEREFARLRASPD